MLLAAKLRATAGCFGWLRSKEALNVMRLLEGFCPVLIAGCGGDHKAAAT
jgi:hypothetical protein